MITGRTEGIGTGRRRSRRWEEWGLITRKEKREEEGKKETSLPRLKQVLRGEQARQKNPFRSGFKFRDLSPIAVESSELEIETPERRVADLGD